MKVQLSPLGGKYYDTQLVLTSSRWHGNVYISISGHPSWSPSEREVANGWEEGDGMDHTEDDVVYHIARYLEFCLKEEWINDPDKGVI